MCSFTGEGQYGKVYTCISVDTGELMAMKEVSVWPSACLSDASGWRLGEAACG